MDIDLTAVSVELERLLRLRSIVFAMQMFERREDMEAIPRIRRPSAVHTLDQIVGQASRLGWTVGVTSDDLVGAQCRAVVGLGGAKTDEWKSGACQGHLNLLSATKTVCLSWFIGQQVRRRAMN